MDPGWRPVPQRPAQVCHFCSVAEQLPSRVCRGHVAALDHHGLAAEVVQCAERPRGQAQDWTWYHERTGAEEWVLLYLLHFMILQTCLVGNGLLGLKDLIIEGKQCAHSCMDDFKSPSDDPQLCSLTGGCFCRSMGVMCSGVLLWLILELVISCLWMLSCVWKGCILNRLCSLHLFVHWVL